MYRGMGFNCVVKNRVLKANCKSNYCNLGSAVLVTPMCCLLIKHVLIFASPQKFRNSHLLETRNHFPSYGIYLPTPAKVHVYLRSTQESAK